MRIVHVITRLVRGGAQKIAVSLASFQQHQDHEVYLLFGPESKSMGSFRDFARANDITMIELPELRRNEHPVYDAIALLKIWKHLRNIDPDVVHTHTSKAGVLGRLAAGFSFVDGVIHTPHGCIFAEDGSIPGVTNRPFLQRLFYWCERVAEPFADRIVSISEAEQSEFRYHSFDHRDHFRVISNGIIPPDEQGNSEEYTPRTTADHWRGEVDIPDERFLVGCVGRMSSEKGQDLLIRTFAEYFDRDPFHLILVGAGQEQENYRALANRLDIQDRITFSGIQYNLNPFWDQVNCYVQPSRYEGFGLAVLEAMFRGIPVVVSEAGGLPELVRHEQTGLIFPGESSKELGEAIRRIFTNTDFAKYLGVQAKQRARKNYTLEQMGKDYMNLYQSVLAEA